MKSILIASATLFLAAGFSLAAKSYTSPNCLVTGNKLGSMRKVITKVYDDQQVKFCCKPCVKKFEANPATYLANLK